MRRTTAAAAATLGLVVIGMAAPAEASRGEHGTPGTKNCSGQAMAYTAQKLHDESWLDPNMSGIGGYVRYQNRYGLDWTVADVRSAVEWYCSS